jgi:hypothetical protein
VACVVLPDTYESALYQPNSNRTNTMYTTTLVNGNLRVYKLSHDVLAFYNKKKKIFLTAHTFCTFTCQMFHSCTSIWVTHNLHQPFTNTPHRRGCSTGCKFVHNTLPWQVVTGHTLPIACSSDCITHRTCLRLCKNACLDEGGPSSVDGIANDTISQFSETPNESSESHKVIRIFRRIST